VTTSTLRSLNSATILGLKCSSKTASFEARLTFVHWAVLLLGGDDRRGGDHASAAPGDDGERAVLGLLGDLRYLVRRDDQHPRSARRAVEDLVEAVRPCRERDDVRRS